jgi:hypothetical protein
MSIDISVEAFSHLPDTEPFQSETSVRKAYVAWRSDLLQQICLHFGWRYAPWDEQHTRIISENDSLMWSTYQELYSLTQNVVQRSKANVFTHFLTRYDHGQLAIYLPVVFDEPFLIERNIYPEKATIASAWRLSQELKALTEFLVNQEGVAMDNVEQARYAHELLSHFAKRSWELRCPLFLSW